MKSILQHTFILCAILFFACNQQPQWKEIQARIKKDDFSVYQYLPDCHCADLEERNGKFYRQDSLYTGRCYLKYPNSDKKYEKRQLFKGQLYGNRILLSLKGDTIGRSIYKGGKEVRTSVGNQERCACEELEKKDNKYGKPIAYLYDEPFTGVCERYFPAPHDTTVYLEIPYENGIIHGESFIYNKNGDLVLKERYVNGKVISSE